MRFARPLGIAAPKQAAAVDSTWANRNSSAGSQVLEGSQAGSQGSRCRCLEVERPTLTPSCLLSMMFRLASKGMVQAGPPAPA